MNQSDVISALTTTIIEVTKNTGNHPEDILCAVSGAMENVYQFVSALPTGAFNFEPHKDLS